MFWWTMWDWEVYRNAWYALLNGVNPYSVTISVGGDMRFMYPIWSLIPIAPFAWIGYPAINIIMVIVTLICLFLVAHKYHMKTLHTFFFVSSAAVFYGIGYGNITFLTLLGLLLPTPIGLFFLIIKPQSTAIVMLILLIKEYEQGGWKRVVYTLMPVTIALIVMILIFGIPKIPNMSGNASINIIWPACLIVGIPATYYAIRKRSMKFAFLASSFISPYMGLSGYMTAGLGFPILTWIFSYAFMAIYWYIHGITYIH